jgi:hypothetical protein
LFLFSDILVPRSFNMCPLRKYDPDLLLNYVTEHVTVDTTVGVTMYDNINFYVTFCLLTNKY